MARLIDRRPPTPPENVAEASRRERTRKAIETATAALEQHALDNKPPIIINPILDMSDEQTGAETDTHGLLELEESYHE